VKYVLRLFSCLKILLTLHCRLKQLAQKMLLRNGTVKIQQLMKLSIQDLQLSKLK